MKTKNQELRKPVMLRLPMDIYDWLQATADTDRRTINAQAAVLFERLKALDETGRLFAQEPPVDRAN